MKKPEILSYIAIVLSVIAIVMCSVCCMGCKKGKMHRGMKQHNGPQAEMVVPGDHMRPNMQHNRQPGDMRHDRKPAEQHRGNQPSETKTQQ